MQKIGLEQTSTALWQDAAPFQPRNCQVVEEVRVSIIRRADRHDAKQLSLLAERTFREAFDRVNTPENMALHCRTSYSESIQAKEISDPNMVTLLCECEERPVGTRQGALRPTLRVRFRGCTSSTIATGKVLRES
jgi:hypothetical protein